MKQLESEIEQACRRAAVQRGWEMVKLVKRAGWPDRLLLGPQGQHIFVEFKRPGEQPRPLQEYILELLREMGHHATWTDNKTDFLKLLS